MTGTQTATLTPSAALTAGTQYTATVSGARDTAGNTMQSTSWMFTTAAPPPSSCPCTIWPASATPATALSSDAGAVELGVKFRADVRVSSPASASTRAGLVRVAFTSVAL